MSVTLQDLGYEHGAATSRYEFLVEKFERIIGKYVQLHMNRCIMCFPLRESCRSIN